MSDWVQKQMDRIRGEQAEEGQKGGPGSGHYGHAGRPGKRGGSQPGKGGGGGPSSSGGGTREPLSRDDAATYLRLLKKKPEDLTILDHPRHRMVEFRWRGGERKDLSYDMAAAMIAKRTKGPGRSWGGDAMNYTDAWNFLEKDSRFPHSKVRIHSWDYPGFTDIEVIGEPGGRRRMKNIDAAKLIARLSEEE